MKLPKRQMVMAGLCAIGVAVFLFDRMQGHSDVLTPESAMAVNSAPAAAQTATAKSILPQGDNFKTRIAARLGGMLDAKTTDLSDVRDAFAVAPTWAPKATTLPAASHNHQKDLSGIFMRKHALQAVMVGPQGPQAVIDNKCYSLGQRIDGFEVTAIGDHSAELVAADGTHVTFRLPTQD